MRDGRRDIGRFGLRMLILLLLSALPAVAAPLATRAAAGFETSLIKIQPGSSYHGQATIQLYAAKNEYESFQIVVNGPLGGVIVSFSDLHGAAGTISASDVRYYREGYLSITTPSNYEGGTGLWPDVLIPDRDMFFNEQRNGFPFEAPAGENRVVWADVFVPPETAAGSYTGTVTVSSSGRSSETLTYSLTVWNFTLPSTSSLPTIFGYDGWEALRGHYGSADMDNHYDMIVPLAKMYTDCGLMNRISFADCMREEWDLGDDPIDWGLIDSRWESFFNGRDLPFGLRNVRLTSLTLPDYGDSDPQRIAFWQSFAGHFHERGWFDVIYDYTYDEPSEAADYQAIIDRANLLHQADPDLPVLVTTDIQEAAAFGVQDIIDIWVPIINQMYGKPYEVCWDQEHVGDHRSDYDGVVAQGKRLYWYQSCMSHGCEGTAVDDTCESEYPSYMVDFSGVRNRIMSWMTYRYDIRGELYFAVNFVDEVGDAWNDQYYFGGNGDGTLLYPGRPDRIGGASHIPIESIRLKHIRDGLEDYEYFKLLEQTAGRDAVLGYLNQFITNAYTYSQDAELMADIRRQIGEAISGTPPAEFGVRLQMPSDFYHPGDDCRLDAVVSNTGAAMENVPLFVILEIAGQYWFWEDWTQTVDYRLITVNTGEQTIAVIPDFNWPDTGGDAMSDIRFWGALTDPAITQIIGTYDTITFSYGP